MFTASIAQEAEGFGRFAPPEDLDDDKDEEKEDESDSEESNEFISSAELRRNRISTKGMLSCASATLHQRDLKTQLYFYGYAFRPH